jgi:GTP cyclohydrolase I
METPNSKTEEVTRPDVCRDAAEDAVRTLLSYLGDDPTRDGLLETPRRVVDALSELTSSPTYEVTTFDSDGYDQMIVQSGIPVYSLCEHHLLPIVGEAHVGYIPDGEVVGLSKLARCVEKHSRQLQNQERITEDVLEDLSCRLDPQGVAVVLEARHFCMEMRGIKKHDTVTTTSALSGPFREKQKARNEFIDFIRA